MICKLCRLDKTLQKSHIIPKFIYKPLRDEKNRIQELSISEEKNTKDTNRYKTDLKNLFFVGIVNNY